MRVAHQQFHRVVALPLFLSLVLGSALAQKAQYTSFAAAEPVLASMPGEVPPALKSSGQLNAETWNKWVQGRDKEVRSRLDQGEENTLTNLLRLGVTYTKQERISYELLAKYGKDPKVNTLADNRANDLIRELSGTNLSPGMQEMRTFLESKGFNLKTPDGRQKVKAYMLANLARWRDDVARASQEVKVNKFQAFKDRGLSTDSDIYPDYTLEVHLKRMMEKGLLKRGSVRRVGIVGPGLDFVNKKFGSDFYPPQTTQPFAVLDTLIRLGLSDPNSLEIYTYDISPRVNTHIEAARKEAAAGKPYVIQLLYAPSEGWDGDYLAGLNKYWQTLGDKIGKPVTPISVPDSASGIKNRAVSVRPEFVLKIHPVDMNVVFQTVPLPPAQKLDLVIGTNIFLYYGDLEQSLARVNLAGMIKPGGFLLSNGALPGIAPTKLADSLETMLPITTVPLASERMFSYERER